MVFTSFDHSRKKRNKKGGIAPSGDSLLREEPSDPQLEETIERGKMESKIRTRSQTSSIIRQGIQYRQTKRPVGERLSRDFLELKEMFCGFVRDYQNTAGVNDVAKKGGQWLQDVEETIDHHIDDYLTKLVHFNDVNEPILSWSDVALAEELLRSQYRDLCLWAVVNRLMVGLMVAYPDYFGVPDWHRDPACKGIEKIHKSLEEASEKLASWKSSGQNIPLGKVFDRFCKYDEKAGALIAWRNMYVSLECEEDDVPCH